MTPTRPSLRLARRLLAPLTHAAFLVAFLVAFLAAAPAALRADAPFTRGDANLDAVLDLSDPVRTLQSLFLTGGEPPCRDAADANDDGKIDISDPLYSLGNLFVGGPFSASVWDSFLDESCLAHHEPTGDAWRCADSAYVARNFITTPYFAHMDVRDSNSSDNWVPIGVSPSEYSLINYTALAAMGSMRADAIEGALMERDPGVFSPTCRVHSGLSSSVTFFEVTVEDAGAAPRNYHDALAAWLAGADVLIVDTPAALGSTCAPGQETKE